MSLRIALVEPYLGGSHRAWAEGYARSSRHEVVVLSHDARFWKWRMQGSYLTLAAQFAGAVEGGGPFDVVLATSMLHLPAFLGAVRAHLGDAATVVYFHESQLTYPLSARDRPDETYGMINWGSAAVADLVLFNSGFHRDTFFAAVPALLKRFPDQRHGAMVDEVRSRSYVLEVGVDLQRFDGVAPADVGPPVILWNQRWEFDKGPAELAAALGELVRRGRDFRVVLTGERFVGQPDGFAALPGALGERLAHFGFAEDDDYVRLVCAADIVVSTALQEFFGISITEACYAGAFPVVPNRLVYPERIPAALHGRCLYEAGGLVDALDWALAHPVERAAAVPLLRGEMARFDWSVMASRYDGLLEAPHRPDPPVRPATGTGA